MKDIAFVKPGFCFHDPYRFGLRSKHQNIAKSVFIVRKNTILALYILNRPYPSNKLYSFYRPNYIQLFSDYNLRRLSLLLKVKKHPIKFRRFRFAWNVSLSIPNVNIEGRPLGCDFVCFCEINFAGVLRIDVEQQTWRLFAGASFDNSS